jgi:hypothetical protein
MLFISKRAKILSLLIIAFLSFVIWQIELEYHGWAGLKWITYFHWAIPIDFALFIVWANLLLDMELKNRVLISFFSILIGVAYFFIIQYCLLFLFGRIIWFPSIYLIIFITILFFILLAILPNLLARLLKIANITINRREISVCSFGMVFSVLLSPLLLEVIPFSGGSDYIHMIKNGILIPLWFFFIGWMLVKAKRGE